MSAADRLNPLRRERESGFVAGICAGLGRHLGADPIVFRVAFLVVAIATGGIGAVLYALAWALIPREQGERWVRRPRPGGGRIAAGVGLLVLSVLLVFRELGLWWSDALTWPLVLAAFGAALLWRQSGTRTGEPETASDGTLARADAAPGRVGEGGPPGSRRPPHPGGWRGVYRGGFGVALVVGAGLLFLYANGVLVGARDAALAAVVVIVGLGLILAPLWSRLTRTLAAERAERIRSEERSELAAHLHDSVLQTLALVQKRAGNPSEVSTLARRQERELRSWLSGDPLEGGLSLAAALQAAAGEVEETHGTPIEVVTVGDCLLDQRAEALVAAAREALVNAAKFAAQGGSVSLYVEAEPERLQVFVHDRGPGFDIETVPADRRGVRESIVARMERHGGRADVRSRAGAGTEIALTLPRETG